MTHEHLLVGRLGRALLVVGARRDTVNGLASFIQRVFDVEARARKHRFSAGRTDQGRVFVHRTSLFSSGASVKAVAT